MKTILEQPRRGKTREALITPHKRSAVWGKARTAIAELCCIIVMAVLCTACDRDRQAITGDYSYKLSGEVVLTNAEGEATYRLIHRNGQMNILRDKSGKDRYIITMNEMTGGCYTMNAELRGDSLVIAPHSFNTNILSTNTIPDFDVDFEQDDDATIVYRISASGGGIVNGNMLIVREIWDGHQSGNSAVSISGPEMTIIAEKN